MNDVVAKIQSIWIIGTIEMRQEITTCVLLMHKVNIYATHDSKAIFVCLRNLAWCDDLDKFLADWSDLAGDCTVWTEIREAFAWGWNSIS